MPLSSPLEKSFALKAPLYERHQALVESYRCLACHDAPCIKACPTSIDVPRFIKAIGEDDPLRAGKIILNSNILGYSCARACPVEELCEGACVLHHRDEKPISIGRLQHFACEQVLNLSSYQNIFGPKSPPTHKRVACIGAGAASIALAANLCLKGHEVEIFEKRDLLGGLNAWGIAPYKLWFDDVQREIAWLKELGIVFHDKSPIETKKQAHDLAKSFNAIFLGIGIGEDRIPKVPAHPNIWGATNLIRHLKTSPTFSLKHIRKAHIIGGGNTAIDAAHELLLLGLPEVTLVYRRNRRDMSAYKHEIEQALKDGLCIRDNLELRDISVNTDQSLVINFESLSFPSDLIVFAIGQNKNMSLTELFENVGISAQGTIIVDALYKTSNPQIWAAGDCVNGGKEVVNAVAEANLAAESMHEFLLRS